MSIKLGTFLTFPLFRLSLAPRQVTCGEVYGKLDALCEGVCVGELEMVKVS